MDGFINLLKPAGMTSHDAVSALRRILCTKKIGHTGTLDPMAAGVLSMCVGAATRAAEYVECDEKEYRCELLLGKVTDTGDIWGTAVEHAGGVRVPVSDITEDMVLEAIRTMEGEQDQYPPIYSAIRKNGKHLYEYARSGEDVEIEPRRITVYSIEPVSVFHEPGRVMFDVKCSKGTYVRSICTDIGEKLGCGAAMSFLVRTRSGSFSMEDAVTLEDIAEYVSENEGISVDDIYARRRSSSFDYDMSRFIVPVDRRLEDFGSIFLNEEEQGKYVNGGRLSPVKVTVKKENKLRSGEKYSDMFCVYGAAGQFLGTAVYDSEKRNFKAGKVFFRW